MTEEQVRIYIKKYPRSVLAMAYRMGLKDKSMELSPMIEKLFENPIKGLANMINKARQMPGMATCVPDKSYD
jgi:hypothetical protein